MFQKWKVSKDSKKTWRKIPQCSSSQMLSHSYATIINYAIFTASSWLCFLPLRIQCSWSLYSSERTDKQYYVINYKGHFRWWQCSKEIKFWCCGKNVRTDSIRKAGLGIPYSEATLELRMKWQTETGWFEQGKQ